VKGITLDIKSKYEKYLEEISEKRQKEIAEAKQEVIKYLQSTKIPDSIPFDVKKMVEIENEFKLADGVLIFKLQN
jgi:hypothetical protein